ncbi:unnamed protein product [Linum trigynum]|uniref:Uncharacterized protein n=1 Tax=Linum trigynum TaxID=586398 RepID=A0AAV2F1F0_9ROSI
MSTTRTVDCSRHGLWRMGAPTYLNTLYASPCLLFLAHATAFVQLLGHGTSHPLCTTADQLTIPLCTRMKTDRFGTGGAW